MLLSTPTPKVSPDDEDSQEPLEFEEEEDDDEDPRRDMGAGIGKPLAACGNMMDEVVHVLHVMAASFGMDVPSFVDALSWGDDANIISGGTRQVPAEVVDHVAALEPVFMSPADGGTSEEELTTAVFSETSMLAHQHAPLLLQHNGRKMLIRISQKIELITLSMLSYARDHHRNRFQEILTFYFKFRGMTAKGFNTVHALRLVMNHKWTCNVVEQMSARAMEEVKRLIDYSPGYSHASDYINGQIVLAAMLSPP
ncbi:hypothetical protein Hypma_007100 [Hypsizygus marmoreus]|uniref:Uncharacterized protein n=1 Tax=Hypsizygus marmoreus TaxID=39966 RepID=A0A369KAV7_HYPMA|nr:hypothetical protein Hypma_007100 [Hypsizygus marmoreus]